MSRLLAVSAVATFLSRFNHMTCLGQQGLSLMGCEISSATGVVAHEVGLGGCFMEDHWVFLHWCFGKFS